MNAPKSMDRRQFLSTTAASVAAVSALGSVPASATSSTRPNIMVIMADDMGYSDIGCYGGEVKTPNLDALAAVGLRFRQFYNAARCCPTRAALLTGLYPHQAGMGGMVSHDDKYQPGAYQGFLNDQCVTLAEVLGNAGYKTYMSGKWHVGEAEENWPCKRDFDRYFGLISGANSYYALDTGGKNPRKMALDDEPYTPPEKGYYMTDAFTDHAVQCIEEHDTDTPFLHYVPYTAPHWPLHALREDIAKYKDRYLHGWDKLREERYARMQAMNVLAKDWGLSPRDEEVPAWDEVEDKEEWAQRMAVYAAMIDRMDQGIGRIIDTLKKKGVFDNTLILFLADNGGCHERIDSKIQNDPEATIGEPASYQAYRRPWANASNTPFRMFKHWVHEGGNSTPLIAHWPEGITARGDFSDTVGHIIDFMPTFVELAQAEYPTTHKGKMITPLPGQSLVSVLQGKSEGTPRTLYWEHFWNAAVRDGDWKLVSHKKGQWELYNLAEDRAELNNRIEDETERADAMREKYMIWAKSIGVRLRPKM